jgi:hypothetical protein
MRSLADGLPAAVTSRIHPDWRKNGASYWAARDSLLSRYRGQRVGFADGAVITAGASPQEIRNELDYAFQVLYEDLRVTLGLYEWNEDLA